MVEDVVDVAAARRGMRLGELPVGVGRPDDPVPAPGDDEQHALLGAQDEPGVELQPVARDDEVDALGRAHLEAPAPAGELLGRVGPDTGRVDDHARRDVELTPALAVADPHAGHPLALAQEADHLQAGADRRTVGGGGARDRHRVTGVVDLGVVVLQRPDQAVLAQRRGERQRFAPREVAVVGKPVLAQGAAGAERKQRVVEQHPRAGVRALPDPMA